MPGVNENGEALYYIQKKNEDGTYGERETTTKIFRCHYLSVWNCIT